jgi:lysozyme
MAFPVVTSRQLKRGGAAATVAAIAMATPFVVGWEGVDYVARHFSFDPPGVVTVCNGITNYDLPGLKPGMKFTKGECAELLKKAMPKYAAPIDRCVKVPITDNTRAALYSASYNLGPGTVCKSSMVRRINAGDTRGGCDALLMYVRANGKFLQGLLNRRHAERKLCLEGL